MMFGVRLKFLVVAVLAVGLQPLWSIEAVAQTRDGSSPPPPVSAGYSSSFRIDGAVAKPATFTLRDFSRAPQSSANVFFVTGKGPVSGKFAGVLLWDLLTQVGVKTDPAVKNDILRRSLVVVGSDGYAVHISAGELHPNFGGAQAIVAISQDGNLLGADSGFAKLIFPGDKAGGRFVSSIASITVY